MRARTTTTTTKLVLNATRADFVLLNKILVKRALDNSSRESLPDDKGPLQTPQEYNWHVFEAAYEHIAGPTGGPKTKESLHMPSKIVALLFIRTSVSARDSDHG